MMRVHLHAARKCRHSSLPACPICEEKRTRSWPVREGKRGQLSHFARIIWESQSVSCGAITIGEGRRAEGVIQGYYLFQRSCTTSVPPNILVCPGWSAWAALLNTRTENKNILVLFGIRQCSPGRLTNILQNIRWYAKHPISSQPNPGPRPPRSPCIRLGTICHPTLRNRKEAKRWGNLYFHVSPVLLFSFLFLPEMGRGLPASLQALIWH